VKSNAKSKINILITIGILFAFLPIITTNFSIVSENSYSNSEFSNNSNLDIKNLKISAVSGKIHIDNNWSAAKAVGICTGNGIYTDP